MRRGAGEGADNACGGDLSNCAVIVIADVNIPRAIDGDAPRARELRVRSGRICVAGDSRACDATYDQLRCDLADTLATGVRYVKIPGGINCDAVTIAEKCPGSGSVLVAISACGPSERCHRASRRDPADGVIECVCDV